MTDSIKDDIQRIRNLLSVVRIHCKNRSRYEGVVFDKLWSIDNDTESALNTLIDIERKLGLRND